METRIIGSLWLESTGNSWIPPLRGPVMWSFGVALFLDRTNCGTNSRFAGDPRRHDAHATSLGIWLCYVLFCCEFIINYQWLKWLHDDVIKWKHFPRYWPFVRGIHRSPVNSPHKGQWRGALMFSLIGARNNSWANNGDAGDLIRSCAHCDVMVM